MFDLGLFVRAQQKEKLTESPSPGNKNIDRKLTAGDHTRTVLVGKLVRCYRIYIPKGYDASKATPVIVVHHRGGGNPEGMIQPG